MKLHAVAPGGPPEGQCKEEKRVWRASLISSPPLKLHAVAPGGPPEGQCKEKKRVLGDW